MSIMQLDARKIKCYTFDDCGKMIKMSLQSLVNKGNERRALVEIPMFGINQVYTFIDLDKMQNYEILKSKLSVQYLSISRVIEDSPIIEGINIKSNKIHLTQLSIIDLIYLSQIRSLLNGMNDISHKMLDSDIRHYLTLGKSIDEDIGDSVFNFVKSCKNRYIMKFKNDKYRFCDNVYTDDFEGIFIYIEEYNCWQYLSRQKYLNLFDITSVTLSYSIVDTPNCFSDVKYLQQYYAEDISEILKYLIYIPVDIYFNKIFSDITVNPLEKAYDSLAISVNSNRYTTSIVLTYDELNINKAIYGVRHSESSLIFMEKFCLLKLINNLISLKP